MGVFALALGREKDIQVKLVKFALLGNLLDAVRDLVGQHDHPGQGGIGVVLAHPCFLDPLLVRVGPVVDLFLDKLAGVQRPERCAGQVQIVGGSDGQPGFVVGVAPVVAAQVLVIIILVLLKELAGVFFPGAKVVLVKDDQVPVGGMHPLVVGLDAAGVFVDAKEVLEGAKADDGAVFVRALVLVIDGVLQIVGVAGDELPTLKIHMGHQVLAPGGLHGGLEGQNQHPGKAHLFRQLIGGKGLAEAHFGVPQKLGRAVGAFLIGRAVVGHSAVHSLRLFRAHGESLGAVFYIVGAAAHGHNGGPHLLHRTAEPLAAHALYALAFQHTVDIVVVKAAAVRVHGALPQYNAVGHAAVRPLGGVLLRHALVHIHGGVAHFQQATVLGVGVLVGVDHGVGGRALGEEVSWHCHHRPLMIFSNQ